MQNKPLKRFIIFLVVAVLISFAVIYFTFDVKAVDYLLLFEPWSIAAALAVLCVGLFFDGTRLINLTKAADEKMPIRDAVKVVLSNYFLALITPGASGGAVAQVIFMKRAGIPTAKATAVVIVRTAMSIGFLLFLVPVILYHDYALVSKLPAGFVVGISIIFMLIPLLFIGFLNTRYPEHWLYAATAKLSKPIRRKCFLWYKEFRKAAFLLGKAPLSVFKAFIESGISLLAIYSVVPVFIAGFGLDLSYQLLMGRMVLLNLLLYFAPTPGGSGIAEAGFIVLFSPLLPAGTVGIMAVLWRFVCEYIPFILGGIVCVKAFGSNFAAALNFSKKDS
ncbi:MAG TPA: flippase-like domain-containing protein [Candidatus Avacidaminococcus intestinavium]|uniref:Phosphatidylglycerol lysyltransferase n=1 Tax=Candidatus Avacidaminococcus intestinavium TaxID=2840684 RepID=A0A9D1SLZ2_9FIRM|nr:flippase-like domain-containing protein [Candidatus Avacidaminococcus intestinavium]